MGTAPHAPESIGWLAIEPGTGSWNGHTYEAGGTPNRVTQSWYTLNFAASFSNAPRFAASMATYNGGDERRGLVWTTEALQLAEALPAFIRPMVIRGTERFARQQGYERVPKAVMPQARQALAGQNGRRMPAFVRRKLAERASPDES